MERLTAKTSGCISGALRSILSALPRAAFSKEYVVRGYNEHEAQGVSVEYGRGVWILPFKGPNGEMILVALDRQERRLAERLVAFGQNGVQAAEDLWVVVDRLDPAPELRLLNPSRPRPPRSASAAPAERRVTSLRTQRPS